jgi:LacI family transcriptional regulator
MSDVEESAGVHGTGRETRVPSRRPSIYTVAERAGVSIATVSRVLGESDRVAPATRERVLAAADELGWRPNRLARRLAGEPTQAVGLVFPDLIGRYIAEVVLGFERVAIAADLGVLVLGTHGRPTAERQATDLAAHVDGLVVMDRTISNDAVRRLEERGTPVVLFARPQIDDIPAVRSENRRTAQELTSHLIEHGHERLAFLGDPDAAPDLRDRWLGFRAAHRAAGRRPPDKPVRSGFSQDEAYAAALSLLDGRRPPTAVACATDELAAGVYGAARDLGLVVARDVALTGWDDLPVGRALSPALTTVHQSIRELGERAANLLCARIAGEPTTSETLPSLPVIRRSCGC